ncbi:hypothetical protein U5801_14765 [Lamprobacter modestohalophilus]|uniref:hypothetical protein n=1 Tax=Lamprobacter modestohalophilus TaxID=1064514 RepID=UPI002ADEAF6E|nr:hypothetical protein [Lamprobacter modestohalophilus]MEA1051062.1 hypothetical protein [Lamprobacter modestohalophilus]
MTTITSGYRRHKELVIGVQRRHGARDDTATVSEQDRSMKENRLATIKFMAFIGFAICFILRKG